VDNLVDSPGVDADILGQSVLRNPRWANEFFHQYLTGVDRGHLFRCHESLLVIVSNLYFINVAIRPTKTDAPLVIDSDTILIAQYANNVNRY